MILKNPYLNHSEAYNHLICILEPVPVYVVLSVFVITGQYSSEFRDANCCVCAGYRFAVVGLCWRISTHEQLNTNIVDSFHIHVYILVSANLGQNSD